MKSKYIISGIVVLIISIIIYFTKGNAYWGTVDYAVIDEKYLLHLFWSLLTGYLGLGLIFVGLVINRLDNNK